jgi:hypothetical protein
MLYVSIFSSDRSRDPELWAAIWHGAGPPSIKLHGAYNLGNNKRIFIWEGESVGDLQFMDRFNHIGVLETYPAFDRTRGWQQAFAKDIESFAQSILSRARPENRAGAEKAVELRRRVHKQPNIYAACAEARKWQEEQGQDRK